MINQRIKILLREQHAEMHKEKICLIEDIIKVKKLLFGFGFEQNNEFLTESGAVQLFDDLHELDIISLRIVLKRHSATASAKARQLAGFNENEA